MLKNEAGRSSGELRERISVAREVQSRRYKDYDSVYCNAQMSSALIHEYCRLSAESEALLREASRINDYSARVINKLLRVARTAADLRGANDIEKEDIVTVLKCRDLDSENARLYTV